MSKRALLIVFHFCLKFTSSRDNFHLAMINFWFSAFVIFALNFRYFSSDVYRIKMMFRMASKRTLSPFSSSPRQTLISFLGLSFSWVWHFVPSGKTVQLFPFRHCLSYSFKNSANSVKPFLFVRLSIL